MRWLGMAHPSSAQPTGREKMQMKKKQVVIGKMIRVCAGGRHAWFESNVGPVRKPYNGGKGT